MNPAKYVIFGISEGTKIKVDKLAKTINQSARMGKDAVVAVIERRGEVIYYKMSRWPLRPMKSLSIDQTLGSIFLFYTYDDRKIKLDHIGLIDIEFRFLR
jgi:hypothetical protein